jgi:hypothetical protein
LVGVSRLLISFALCIVLPELGLAQGPVFLTPPNTAPAGNLLPSFSFFQKGSENDLSLQASYGVRRDVMIGLGAMAIQLDSGPFQLGRLQAQAKYRLFQKVGDGTRTVVGTSAAFALPLGEFVQEVARNAGATLHSISVTAAHMGRRTGYFSSALYTSDAHFGGNRSTGTAGVALSWRLKPAPPGVTGGPGLTLFAETLAHYEANHSGWLALAPGFVLRAGETQIKGGARIPVRRWNTTSTAVLTLGTSVFFHVGG